MKEYSVVIFDIANDRQLLGLAPDKIFEFEKLEDAEKRFREEQFLNSEKYLYRWIYLYDKNGEEINRWFS